MTRFKRVRNIHKSCCVCKSIKSRNASTAVLQTADFKVQRTADVGIFSWKLGLDLRWSKGPFTASTSDFTASLRWSLESVWCKTWRKFRTSSYLWYSLHNFMSLFDPKPASVLNISIFCHTFFLVGKSRNNVLNFQA